MGLEQVKIAIIYDNRKDNSALQQGWGFSSLIEWEGRKILFDTGANVESFFNNLEKLHIHLNEITHLVFSHKHADHTTGFEEVLNKLPKTVSIYLPKTFPRSFLKKIPLGMKLQQVRSFAEIDKDIYSLVLRGGFFFREQCLILNTSKGLVVITGCAHPGIVPILEAARKKLAAPIYLVLGGFHLFRSSKDVCTQIIDQFQMLGVKKVAPCHCSGDQIIQQFHDVYAGDFLKIGTGTILTI